MHFLLDAAEAAAHHQTMPTAPASISRGTPMMIDRLSTEAVRGAQFEVGVGRAGHRGRICAKPSTQAKGKPCVHEMRRQLGVGGSKETACQPRNVTLHPARRQRTFIFLYCRARILPRRFQVPPRLLAAPGPVRGSLRCSKRSIYRANRLPHRQKHAPLAASPPTISASMSRARNGQNLVPIDALPRSSKARANPQRGAAGPPWLSIGF